MRKGKREKVI